MERLDPAIRRILVALNVVEANFSAIEAGFLLASRLEAQLAALLVEDINLLHLAELPFAAEIGRDRQVLRSLDSHGMARSLRVRSEQARRALLEQTQGRRLAVSFRQARGQWMEETLAAAAGSDLLIVARDYRGVVLQGPETRGVVAVVRGAPCSVLVTGQSLDHASVVQVLYDGTPASRRALATAIKFVEDDQRFFVALIPSGNPVTARALAASCHDIAAQHGCDVRIRAIGDTTVTEMQEVLRNRRIHLLILGHDSLKEEDGDILETLLRQIPCPVLLIR